MCHFDLNSAFDSTKTRGDLENFLLALDNSICQYDINNVNIRQKDFPIGRQINKKRVIVNLMLLNTKYILKYSRIYFMIIDAFSYYQLPS